MHLKPKINWPWKILLVTGLIWGPWLGGMGQTNFRLFSTLKEHSQTNKAAPHAPNFNIKVPDFFQTSQDIDLFFETNRVDAIAQTAHGNSADYYLALGYYRPPLPGLKTGSPTFICHARKTC